MSNDKKFIKASAAANANIALVKYWGKRNEDLILPYNSSISLVMSDFTAHTTVDFNEGYQEDLLVLNGQEFRKGSRAYDKYTGRFLRIVRKMAGTNLRAKIASNNNFPTAAGLASSAAGFAALATAASESLRLKLSKKELSMLARQGSGSATRSIFGGFVKWRKGDKEDGSDSYAEQIASPGHWPDFRIIACITSEEKKRVSSRVGMAQTVATSPMYGAWLDSAEEDIEMMLKGIREKKFTLVGEISERNCLKLHAVAMTTEPSIIYWNKTTVEIIHSIIDWRREGLESYFTIDAGPQVKIICREKDVEKITDKCKGIEGIKQVIPAKAGEGARVVSKHLF